MNQVPYDIELLEDYNDFAKGTSIYPDAGSYNEAEAMYLALGLANEAGEVAGKIKKMYRDGTCDFEAVAKEIGDVMWYATRLADFTGIRLSDIIQANMAKLKSRQERGVLGGSGDER